MQLWRRSLLHNRGNADRIRIGNSQFMMMSVKPSRAQQKNYCNIRLAPLAILLGSHEFFRCPGSEEVVGYALGVRLTQQ